MWGVRRRKGERKKLKDQVRPTHPIVDALRSYDAWVRLPGGVSRTGDGDVLGTVRIRLGFVPRTNPWGWVRGEFLGTVRLSLGTGWGRFLEQSHVPTPGLMNSDFWKAQNHFLGFSKISKFSLTCDFANLRTWTRLLVASPPPVFLPVTGLLAGHRYFRFFSWNLEARTRV